jgi:UDP-N-acetylmuramoyl-tripeptide--D-alanyl-D-alanine ligase
MSAQRLAKGLNGRLLAQGPESHVYRRVSTDSRTLQPGDVYVALKGERFDGEKFFKAALARGAGALVGRRLPKARRVALIETSDSLRSLQDLAADQRRIFQGPVIAITGSNGKTSAKECLAWLLGGPSKVLATPGNWNNHIGVPLTLLGALPGQQAAVLELGMNHFGEIKRLTEICRPDIAVVLNVGDAHLEFFKTRLRVAKAKEELLQGMRGSGIAVLNGDDPLVRAMGRRFKGRVLYFGIGPGCDVRATQGGDILKSGGRVRLYQALAALAAGLAAGFSMESLLERLRSFRPQAKNRQQLERLKGANFILDMYNASPQSMAAALEHLKASAPKGRALAVLGEMLELGPKSAGFHWQAGRAAKAAGLRALAAVGPHAKQLLLGFGGEGKAFHKEEAVQAAAWLRSRLKPEDWILVKGSRGMKLERVVEALKRN